MFLARIEKAQERALGLIDAASGFEGSKCL